MAGRRRSGWSFRQRLQASAQILGELVRKRPAPRPVYQDTDQNRLTRINRCLPRGFGSAATIAILLASVGTGVVRGNHLADIGEALSDARDALANAAGFRIAHVTIAGRTQLSQDEILAIGGVTGKRSLLFLNAAEVRDKLKASPWISDATVLKLYPDSVQIDVTERKAFALWQVDGTVSVISEQGLVLEPYSPGRFKSLPLIVGKGADKQAKDFIGLLEKHPSLRPQVKAIILVSERRWNLRLADGIDVRLPEKNVEAAVATLAKLDRDEKLFSKDITAIDLRLPDRLTVRLSEDAAKARADMLKEKEKANKKRKANEA